MIGDGDILEALNRLIEGKISAAFTGEVLDNSEAKSKGIVKVKYNDFSYKVRLKSIVDGKKQHLLLIPKKNSKVFCVPEGNSQERYLAIAFNELESVETRIGETSLEMDESGISFNGGKNGGMGIVSAINDNISQLKDYVEAIHAAMPSAFNAIGAGTAASGQTGATTYSTSMQGKSISIKAIENEKVKH